MMNWWEKYMKVNKKIVDKRRNDIMKIIQTENKVDVLKLAEQFHVSPLTIRRDLQYWESLGAIVRNYGGASLIQDFVENDDYDKQRYMHAIAKRAASFVENDDVIFINSSQTALMVLEFIKNKRVTVITNNAKAINYTPDFLVTVVFTGGEVRFPKNSMTGDFALSMLNNITADKCFIGCSGLDEEGISTELMKEMLINQTMLKRTKNTRFVLCDHHKFGLNYSFRYSSFDSIHVLITDVQAQSAIVEAIEQKYMTQIIRVEPVINLNQEQIQGEKLM